MGLINVPTEAKQALKVLYSIDVSLGRIADVLEEMNERQADATIVKEEPNDN